jgi:tetratricopeptide (TPR) repeat protein
MRRGEQPAREDLEAALGLAPDFVDARVALAALLARSGDAQRAATLLRDGIAAARRPRARLTLERALGEVLIAVGDYRGAEEALTRAAAGSEGQAVDAHAERHLRDRLARLRAKTGRFAEALDELLAAARAEARRG